MNPQQPLTPDATPDVPVEAPVQPATEQAQPAPAPVDQQVPEAPAPVAQEPIPAPVVEEEEDYSFDPIPTFNLPQRPVVQQQEPQNQVPQQPQAPQQQAQPLAPLDPNQFADQYGNVDMVKFSQAMAARDAQMTQMIAQQVSQQVMQNVLPQAAQISAQQMMTARAEERAWGKAEEKYPELKSNKELRDLVHKQRLSVIQGGGNESPVKAADRLFKYIGQARQEGQQQATESVRIQAAAHLESADNTAAEQSSASRDAYQRIGSKNKAEASAARQAILKGWLTDGKLDQL